MQPGEVTTHRTKLEEQERSRSSPAEHSLPLGCASALLPGALLEQQDRSHSQVLSYPHEICIS